MFVSAITWNFWFSISSQILVPKFHSKFVGSLLVIFDLCIDQGVERFSNGSFGHIYSGGKGSRKWWWKGTNTEHGCCTRKAFHLTSQAHWGGLPGFDHAFFWVHTILIVSWYCSSSLHLCSLSKRMVHSEEVHQARFTFVQPKIGRWAVVWWENEGEDEDFYNLWKGWSFPDDSFFLEHLLIEGARAHYRQWGLVEFCAVCWWRSHQLLDISCLSQHAYFSGKEDIFCHWFSGSWPDIGPMVFWNVWWALMLMSLITPNSSCI